MAHGLLKDFRQKLVDRLVTEGRMLACTPTEFGRWVSQTWVRLLQTPADKFTLSREVFFYHEDAMLGSTAVRLNLQLCLPSQDIKLTLTPRLTGDTPIAGAFVTAAKDAVNLASCSSRDLTCVLTGAHTISLHIRVPA
jgi:hypothetical protein